MFAYVYMNGDDCDPIDLSEETHAALLLPGADALSLLAANIKDPAAVEYIEVETGDDCDEQGYPDATNPDTRRVYTRAGV